jgi:hypothetical protein
MSKLLRQIGKVFGVFLMAMALSTSAFAEKYRVQILKVTSVSDTGDVIIQFKPGGKEDGFDGRARAMLLGTDLGANKSLAIILSAVSLDAEVLIQVESPPTNDFVQVISSIGFSAP